MTNIERLHHMNAQELASEFERYAKYQLREYLDMEKYMNGESTLFSDYLKTEGTCQVIPTEMEIVNVLGKDATETERDFYIKEHTRTLPVLEKRKSIFGNSYVVVAEAGQKMSIPETYVIMSKEE